MVKKTLLMALYTSIALSVAAISYAEVSVEKGREIFHARGKPKYPGQVIGNCTACHWVVESELQNGDQPGNIGPAFVGMKARYPDKQDIFKKIWDPVSSNPKSIMPPFGVNGMMSKQDIQSLVEYIHTL